MTLKTDWKPPKRELKPRKFLKRTRLKKTYRKTNELQLFIRLWNERPRYCEVTGKPIRHFDVCVFAHLCSKGSRPDLRLNPDNIVILTPELHYAYDNYSKEKVLYLYPGAEILFEKKEQLKAIPVLKK